MTFVQPFIDLTVLIWPLVQGIDVGKVYQKWALLCGANDEPTVEVFLSASLLLHLFASTLL
jgi:hypothetical protein